MRKFVGGMIVGVFAWWVLPTIVALPALIAGGVYILANKPKEIA